MRTNRPGLIVLCGAAVLLTASPEAVWAQACSGGLALEATQIGQDVRIDVSLEQFGSSGMHVLVTRGEGGDIVEARGELEDEGCSLTMPEPATGCGCWSLAGAILDECVPPGTHEYTVYEEFPDASTPEPPAELGTVTVTVADTGDACLPSGSGEGGGSCAVAGEPGRLPPLLLIFVALLVAWQCSRRGAGAPPRR